MDEAGRHCAAMMGAMHELHRTPDGLFGASGMMPMGGMGGMLVFGLLWLIVLAALATLLLVGAISLWRRRQPAATSAPTPSAQEILDRRYAAGELDRETYVQIRSDIQASG
jgi:putative membrane protein